MGSSGKKHRHLIPPCLLMWCVRERKLVHVCVLMFVCVGTGECAGWTRSISWKSAQHFCSSVFFPPCLIQSIFYAFVSSSVVFHYFLFLTSSSCHSVLLSVIPHRSLSFFNSITVEVSLSSLAFATYNQFHSLQFNLIYKMSLTVITVFRCFTWPQNKQQWQG